MTFNYFKKNTYIKINGWIKHKRYSKLNFIFLIITNGLIHDLQIVVSEKIHNIDEIKKITIGTSVEIEGFISNSFNKHQEYELYASKILILSLVKDVLIYPITSKTHSLEFLRKNAHFRSRTKLFNLINKIRNHLYHLIHNFFFINNYYWVPSPILTSLDVEDDVELFNVENKRKNFFTKEISLSVSGQLHLEAIACAMSKVYCFGPVFRAENSNTNRHLSEFWMLEVETSFMKFNDLIILIDNFIKYLFKHILIDMKYELSLLEEINKSNISKLLNSFLENKIIIITYKEAINILLNSNINFNKKIILNQHLTSEHESYLSDIYFKQIIGIVRFPPHCKAFYMKNDKGDSLSIDIIFPYVGEVIGGSEREDNFNKLRNKLIFNKMNINKYLWYLDLRKFGNAPHSGFGLGFERLLMYITGMKNIRDISPFPRTKGRFLF